MGEMKTAYCQHACPQIHHGGMKAPLWNVRRNELSQYPHHDPQIGVLSLVVPVVPGAQLIENCNFHQLQQQRMELGCPPECGQIKGEASSPNTQFPLQVAEPASDKSGYEV